MIPTTIEGFSKTYIIESTGWMGGWFPIHFHIKDVERIGEVYGDSDVTADLWHITGDEHGYKATFADPTEAAQWVVNEYERRNNEGDWR